MDVENRLYPSGAPSIGEIPSELRRIADLIEAAAALAPLTASTTALGLASATELSPRQWEIVRRLVDGERVTTIAAAMFLSRSTIRNHLSAIYAKVGVHTQHELIALHRRGTPRRSGLFRRDSSVIVGQRIGGYASRMSTDEVLPSSKGPSALSDAVLLAALEGGEPSLVFQPIVDLRDRRLIGVEALSRFNVEPYFTPDVWFESAHRLGCGVALELTVLRRAAAAATQLPLHLYIAVNVSPNTIVVSDIAQALEGAPIAQVILEITEHAPVDDYAPLLAAIARLRELGARIAIDDVGAGFSTLRHVLRLDPEIIKLDQEVTLGVESDMSRAKLVGGLIAGASAVSAIVVAEGIETEAQLARLLDLGIRGGQGYLLGRPVELDVAIATGEASAASLALKTDAASAERRRRALEGAHILVVDDSVGHRSLIRTIFELEGATVDDAATAAEASHAIETDAPDIVLLDVRLPDGNGFEVLDLMRGTSPELPIVIVSAASAVSDRVSGLDGGADDYVLKPFSPDELVARVDAVLRRRSRA